MKVYAQVTSSSPADWLELDSSAWDRFPRAKECYALCVQGDIWEGYDEYAVFELDGVVHVVGMCIDLGDWPRGSRWVRVGMYYTLAPDPQLNGAINTRNKHIIYAEEDIWPQLEKAYRGNPRVAVRAYTELLAFPENRRRGIWVTDDEHLAHQRVRAIHGWREWTEGLDPRELDGNGKVKPQRTLGRFPPARGTRTYYHNPGDLAIGAHAADHENQFGLTATGATNESTSINQGGGDAWAAATPANEPDSAAWPTTGVYRYQLDVNSVGSDLTFGLLTQGGGSGHFCRLNSALSSCLQSIVQDQSAFSGAGLHLASITDPSWSSGTATDRFGVLVASVRVAGHGGQTIQMQLGETDDYADGPWSAAAGTPQTDVILFGTNF